VSYPTGAAPHPPPAPHGVPGGLSGARQALSIVWALAPLYTCGLLTFAVITVAAARLRTRFQVAAALAYFFLLVPVALSDVDNESVELISIPALFINSIGGLVHALLIREKVFRPMTPRVGPVAAPPRGPVRPGPAAPPMPHPAPPGTHGPATPPTPARVTPPTLGPGGAPPPRLTGPAPGPPGPMTPPGHAPGSWPAPSAPGVPGPSGPSGPWHPSPGAPPRRFGPYLLLDKLGAGGQGTVYLARHPDGSQVALKMLHQQLSEKERESFIREVSALQRVPSYSTARVIDAGVMDGCAYIVSEYVDGPSLQRRVQESGPLSADSLIRLAIATSGALAAIHRAGIVHRDFKPANVLLAPDGPRVIDFGVAKALDQVTTTAGVKGTPLYMSPEQINGEPVTPASDMFSWASTMIYGGTGRVAFAGSNPYQVLHQIMSMEPDLSGLPGPLIRPVAACLDKNPRNRPQAAEIISAITG
jgi:Serine/threonine protein kinase